MASASFEVDDQTDEDFFDRLVNDDDDEINVSGSGVSFVKTDVTDEVEAFSNLSVSEVGPLRVDSGANFDFSVEDSKDGVVSGLSASSKDKEDAVVAEESNVVAVSRVNESSAVGSGEECVFLDDGVMAEGNVGTGMGLKEVQWSSFESNIKVDGGSGLRLDSDFFGELGDGSGDPFANIGNTDKLGAEFGNEIGVFGNVLADLGSSDYGKNQDAQNYGQSSDQNVDGQDLSSCEYWKSLYPGWRYDPNTGQWHQLDGYVADLGAPANTNAMESVDAQSGRVLEQRSDLYNLQQTAQAESVMGSTVEGAADISVTNWNQVSAGTADYPAHMVFDPQYPGWYYDTVAQEWRSLESYTQAINQSTTSDSSQQFENNIVENYGLENLGGQNHVTNWGGSVSNYSESNTNMWYSQPVDISETTGFAGDKQLENPHGSTGHLNSSVEQQIGFMTSGSIASNEIASWGVDHSTGVSGSQTFIASQQFSQQYNQSKMEASQHNFFNPSYIDSQKPVTFPPQQVHSRSQFPYAPSESRSSAGRPPHAQVTFGFGGKLVVLNNNCSFGTNSAGGSKDSSGGVITVLNLMEVMMEKIAASNFGSGTCDYFHSLCQQSFPGPLVGGNVGNKELNKWIDERIANCESSSNDYINGEVMSLLFCLLKIACQYYGKLRSPFGTDPALKESDCPESAVAKLFGSAKKNDFQLSYYGAQTHCLQNLPAEAQIQATALEVQKLLVLGRKKEALECAREGQLWGPALVLASQLGDQFYGDTVKQMALRQLVAGSPLRTLCLLIAGQPADVFSKDGATSIIPGSVNTFQQHVRTGANLMLDNWEENLAIITANRTKGDELVVVHFGDCLWKERGEVTAAHVCYLVAESNFEPYSDSARLCLIGADHWKFPRTYASPQAIQRTELYEYAKVLGNPQFLLLPFQPYKLIYAHMLAEVGKVADSLKYCQAIMKSLKTSRTPEVDTWKQIILSLEERLRTHQQGGYSNLARNNLFGKFINFFDSTANRVVGGVPPPVPSHPQSNFLPNEFAHHPGGLQVSSSQSTMVMPPLMPHASVEHSNFLPNEFAHHPGGLQVSGSQSTMVMPPLMPHASMEHSNFLPNEFAHQPGGLQVSGSQSTMVMPPLMPHASMEHSNFLPNEFAHQPGGLQVSGSQSTMVMPPLMPHASMEHSNFLPNEFAHRPGGLQVSGSQSTMVMPPLMPHASMEYSNFLPNEFAHQPGGLQVSGSQSTMVMPPLMPHASMEHSNFLPNEFAHRPGGLQVSGSQSTMVMPPLMPHASMEHISEWTGETNQLNLPNKSVSEPDFSKKVDSSDKSNVSDKQEKASASGGSSRFGRFGSQFLRNTVGFVLKSRSHKEAKLGEKNKFYYDEKLKRWVEEGADPPAEEPALAPPPTFPVFQNGTSDNNVNAAPKIESFLSSSGPDKHSSITSDRSPGMPPIPPSSNQFSARGKMGVRSRYVDTFNKGGATPANLFQSPAISSSKPGTSANPKFFVPIPVSPGEEMVQTTGESTHEAAVVNENPTTSLESFASPPTVSSSAAMTVHRFPSMDNIIHKRTGLVADVNNSFPTDSRRVASWSGSLSDAGSPMMQGIKPLGQTLGLSASFSSDSPSNQLSQGSNSSNALHEVEPTRTNAQSNQLSWGSSSGNSLHEVEL